MDNFNLNYRVLFEEEKVILFGRNVVKNLKFNVIKINNVENYYDIFQRVYEGKDVIIPDFINETTPIKIYLFCDIPAGSKYFNSNSYGNYSFVYRDKVQDTPVVYSKFRINELITPALTKAIEVFTPLKSPDPALLYNNVGFSYTHLSDVIQSGMFATLYEGKIISLSSVKTLHYNSMCNNSSSLRALGNLTNTTSEEIKTVYAHTMFNLPAKTVEEIIGKELEVPKKFILDTEAVLGSIRNEWNFISPSFAWITGADTAITLGPDFINLNGFVYTDSKVYMLLGTQSNSSPLSNQNASNLSSSIDFLFVAIASNTFNSASVRNIFSFSNTNRTRANNSGSFVFLNKDNLEVRDAAKACGVHEFVELNKEFLDSVKQIYIDNASVFSNPKLVEKFKKSEFAVKRESIVSEEDVVNSRYIPLQSRDKKLLVLTKTSLAKEAARKMAITRKISTLVSPAIDMAMRLFALRDFELGFKEKKSAFALKSKYLYRFVEDNDAAFFAQYPTLKPSFELHKASAYAGLASNIKKLTASVIPDLYNTITYEGSPLWTTLTGPLFSSYSENFNYYNQTKKENKIWTHIMEGMQLTFNRFKYYNSACIFSDYFSPASGLLNISNLTRSLYFNVDCSMFKAETSYIPYEYGNSATGKALAYVFDNNLLGVDQKQSEEVERFKHQNYFGLSNDLITATSVFTFQQDVLDSFIRLKKAKTITDYCNWFVEIRPTLEQIVKDNLETDEYMVSEGIKFFLESSEQMLKQLSVLEIPFLPKEEVKKRGRKPKSAATVPVAVVEEDSAENVDTTEVSSGEEDVEPAAVE